MLNQRSSILSKIQESKNHEQKFHTDTPQGLFSDLSSAIAYLITQLRIPNEEDWINQFAICNI